MNKVITINLNGRAYQLEEAGYEALRKYLDEARAALRDDPDKDEIMADFEQAVADKCDTRLKNGKNVVSAKEIEEIIAKMGPVDGGKKGVGAEDIGAAGMEGAGKTGTAPKRLYRIMEGSVLKGVCSGIAAYFNIDATLVRVLFVLLTVFTGGGWIIAYIVLAIVMPIARTADEVAQAHGEPPFTAKDFIDRARAEYEKYKADPSHNKQEWKQHMREWRHEWRNEWREKRRAWREWRKEQRAEQRAERSPCAGAGIAARIVGGLITAVIIIIWIVVLAVFLAHGMLFGHPFGVGHPLWVSLLFLIAALYLVTFPFRLLAHHSCHYGPYGHHYHGGGLGFLILLAVLIYTSVLLFPSVHTWWSSVIAYLQSVR